MERALADVTVVDLTHHVAGPYCTKLLADYGANIIKVERPDGGDPARRMGPFPHDEPHTEKSGLFLYLNTNKKGITLNLKSPTGRRIFLDLIRRADIVVESFRPRVMPNLGLDYEALAKANPRLVVTSISSFGQTGPYRDFKATDITLYATGGIMHQCGVPERAPLKYADHIVAVHGGAVGAAATMGALYCARASEEGQHIDVSVLETQMGSIDMRAQGLIAYQFTGEYNPRLPESGQGYPIGSYPCKDGYFRLLGGMHAWDAVERFMGYPDFLKDPKWRKPTAQGDPQLREEFETHWIEFLMERTMRECWIAGQAAGLTCAPLYTVANFMEDPHFVGRGVFTDIDHPVAGRLKYPGRPFIMGESPWAVERPAPTLGQHNAEVYGSLGYGPEDLVMLRQAGVI